MKGTEMKIFSSKKRVAAIGVMTAATLVGGGMAYAYWTTTGSGAGTATTAVSDATFAITQDPLDDMYPGDVAQTLSLDVTINSATQNAAITTLTATLTPSGGCDASNYLVNGVPAVNPVTLIWNGGNGPTDIGALDTVTNTDNTIQFNNKGVPQDECRGAVVAIAYSSS
jgi:hypothetical protein